MQEYFAVCHPELEEVTIKELSRLPGITSTKAGYGGVYFETDLEGLYRANLESRTVIRILEPIKDFASVHSEMLYAQVNRLKWETLIKDGATILIDTVFSGSKKEELSQQRTEGIKNSLFAAQKIKDAIVDRLREKTGNRPSVDKEDPDVRLHAYFYKDRCLLSFDTSGRSLHKRDYRIEEGSAPIKETFAAALLELMDWSPEKPLLDGMCGTGTLLIEAAERACGMSSGLRREKFGFMGLGTFDEKIWKKVLSEARSRVNRDFNTKLYGCDGNRHQLEKAMTNAQSAGVGKKIQFGVKKFRDLLPPGEEPGILFLNPPYGERLGEPEDWANLYQEIGDIMKNKFQGWTAYILVGNKDLMKKVGLRPARRIPVWNGPIECRLLKYELYQGSKK